MSPNEILCVDDDLDILSTVARLLRAVGHLVTAVDTPASALAILGARPIAVLVSDFEMPEMNGVELAVRAREIQPETVRIMLTGHRTVETAMQGINVGEVFRFLSKPFDPEHLQREVAAALAHHRERLEVAREHLTVVRRQRLVEALEADHPGISTIPRDDHGAYLLDGEARERVSVTLMAPVLALFREADRQP